MVWCGSPAAAVDSLPRPVGLEPACDGIGEGSVEFRSVHPNPGLDSDVPLRPRGWVQVNAADDIIITGIENGERETGAAAEVVRVIAKIGEVRLKCQAAERRPVVVGKAGSGAYVFDARHPGSVVGLIVLGSQRFEPELVGSESSGRIEADGHEFWDGHDRDPTSRVAVALSALCWYRYRHGRGLNAAWRTLVIVGADYLDAQATWTQVSQWNGDMTYPAPGPARPGS
jgi:hypothetical protein